jgi:hypothetical protein
LFSVSGAGEADRRRLPLLFVADYAKSKKKGSSILWNGGAFIFCYTSGLHNGNIDGRRSFLTLLYVKGNAIAFIEGLETGSIDS